MACKPASVLIVLDCPGAFVGNPQYVTFGRARSLIAANATWDCLPAYRQLLRMESGGAMVHWEPSRGSIAFVGCAGSGHAQVKNVFSICAV